MSDLDKFRHKFIVLEGIDSTGKTSVGQLLVNMINKAYDDNEIDFNARFTYQPGDAIYGQIAPLIRSFCKDKRWGLSKYGNLFAFLLDRAESVYHIINPSLQLGQTVVCDRYTYSTVAYQLFGKQIYDDIKKHNGATIADALMEWFINPYPDVRPDIVYYFPQKVGIREDADYDMFDKASSEFNDRVKAAYERMYTIQVPKGTIWKKVLPGNSAEETLQCLLKQ
jgi:thymidylate kinase